MNLIGTSVFADLSNIDVSAHLETKQGLSYLQWMACWALVKNYDPEASFVVHVNENGSPAFESNGGAFVRTSVTIKGQTLTEVLPVLDFKNKAIPIEKLGVFDINSAYKRCLVKTCAMHGLGAQVYINGKGSPLNLDEGLAAKNKPKMITKKAASGGGSTKKKLF